MTFISRRARKVIPNLLVILLLVRCFWWIAATSFEADTLSSERKDADADIDPFNTPDYINIGAPTSKLGAIVYLYPTPTPETFNVEFQALCKSIRYFYHNFNNDAGYPVYIFLQDASKSIQDAITLELNSQSSKENWMRKPYTLLFVPIKYGAPERVIQDVNPLYVNSYPRQNHVEYTRFQSLIIHPALRNYEYVWSMNYNSVIKSALRYDPIEVMHTNSQKYAYNTLKGTKYDKIIMLWNTVSRISQDAKQPGNGNIEGTAILAQNGYVVPSKRRRNAAGMFQYNVDFEIMHVSTFRDLLTNQAIVRRIIDSKGSIFAKPIYAGIYEYGWDASTLRWITIQYILDVAKSVTQFCDLEFSSSSKDELQIPTKPCSTNFKHINASPNFLRKTSEFRRIVTKRKDQRIVALGSTDATESHQNDLKNAITEHERFLIDRRATEFLENGRIDTSIPKDNQHPERDTRDLLINSRSDAGHLIVNDDFSDKTLQHPSLQLVHSSPQIKAVSVNLDDHSSNLAQSQIPIDDPLLNNKEDVQQSEFPDPLLMELAGGSD